MNISTIIVLLLVLIVLAFAVWSMIRDRKNGKPPCGGNCGGCTACSYGQKAVQKDNQETPKGF